MKTKVLFPFVLFALLVLAVGLACSINVGTPATSAPPTQVQQPQQPQQQPTNPPPPTNVPQPTVELPSATAETPAFFIEEFDGTTDINNWTYYITGPNSDKYSDTVSLELNDGSLEVKVPETQLYVYMMYDPYTYQDVRLTMQAENRGANTNNVSLVCRYDSDANTWYEFSVGSGGDWYLYAVKDGYNTLYNGGSTALNQGKAVNQYGFDCIGNKLYLYVNGTQLKGSPVTDTQYALKEGQVGFNVSSLDILDVEVDVDWIDIAQP